MERKENKVAKFVKDHKKEIAIALVAAGAGVLTGVAGHAFHVNKNWGGLMNECQSFDRDPISGDAMSDTLAKFLEQATHSAWRTSPRNLKTVADLGEDFVEAFGTVGIEPTAEISDMMIAIKR